MLGKKINSGTRSQQGEVNVFGFEEPSLKQKQLKLKMELDQLEETTKQIEDHRSTQALTKAGQEEIYSACAATIQPLSQHIRALTQQRVIAWFTIPKLYIVDMVKTNDKNRNAICIAHMGFTCFPYFLRIHICISFRLARNQLVKNGYSLGKLQIVPAIGVALGIPL